MFYLFESGSDKYQLWGWLANLMFSHMYIQSKVVCKSMCLREVVITEGVQCIQCTVFLVLAEKEIRLH